MRKLRFAIRLLYGPPEVEDVALHGLTVNGATVRQRNGSVRMEFIGYRWTENLGPNEDWQVPETRKGPSGWAPAGDVRGAWARSRDRGR